ncbi:ATP-binding cassette domain-containing protein [Nocardioides sp. B-3]|uniref:ATP-binding cassette domain-containing protein n=1 Tax=Nocardioides sp. B-3 TaxID=2895565 RepID=UPI0021535D39|nr:ATP-binding cassette domain-containing protein [Nocardioides sp. B-3]UUZ60209.1 ATP-binding cassette domain-containing protein [Nocardioides sp. B-3]
MAPEKLPMLSVRGTFDPANLLQGTTLGKVPLETYQSPAVEAGDTRTREALGGEDLYPGSNPAGYLQNPPLMLTTLSSLPAITAQGVYGWSDPQAKSEKPISVVRIRVADVTGADELSRERVRVVAQAIKAATGLDVDITIGSSPAPTSIQLETDSGDITVVENWVEKGVAERIVNAVDKKSLGLFVLILLTTGLSVGISANASVRARQRELAVLACPGWRPSTLYRSVLLRLLTIGAIAGMVGAAASWPLGFLFDTPVSRTRAALAIPAAGALMLLVGIWPALTAARSTPATTIRNVARPPRRARPLKGPASLGIAYLLRRPSRPLTASLAPAVGVASVVVLVGISIGFSGTVVGNLLGNAVALQVRSADLTAGFILCTIGIIAVLDVLILDVKEQASGYASLQASGWRDDAVVRLVMAQAVIISSLGAALGALLGLTILNSLVGISAQLLTLTAAITAARILVGALVSTVPASDRDPSQHRPHTRRGGTVTVTEVQIGTDGPAVSLRGVTKEYRLGDGSTLRAADAITHDIPSGVITTFMGASGSGKSTLLHLIGSIDTPDSGSITVAGTELSRLNRKQRADYRSRIGFIFQRYHLLPALTALDNVLAPLAARKVNFDKHDRARDLLSMVGLKGREDSLPSQLSGGQQQR